MRILRLGLALSFLLLAACASSTDENVLGQESAQNEAAAPRAKVALRSGERIECRLLDMGAQFTLSVNGEERRYNPDQVTLIDLVGNGTELPEAELASIPEAGASHSHLVVMRDGGTFAAKLLDLSENPMKFVFDTPTGERRELAGHIARVYMAERSFFAPPPPPPPVGKHVRIEANQQWVDTGIDVRWGQTLFFTASGTVLLSSNARDTALPAGSTLDRRDRFAPIPSAPAGAIIGQVGGLPILIGDQPAVQMSAGGRLLIGINEYERFLGDNSGWFDVTIEE